MHRTIRSQPANVLQTNIPRPLSSADEAGPVQKRLRSTAGRQIESSKAKSTTKTVDDPLKKARARQALSFANNLSTSNSQPASNARGTSAVAKPTFQASANPTTTRRSNRLQSGSGAKQLHLNKVSSNGADVAEHQLMFSSTLLQHETAEGRVINPARWMKRPRMASRSPNRRLLDLNCHPLRRRGRYNKSSRLRKNTSRSWRISTSMNWSASSPRPPGG